MQHIYHKCGHVRELDMGLSSRSNRIKRAEDMGKSCCPQCEFHQILTFEEKEGLPTLKGSMKQIKWATLIRHEKLNGKYIKHWDRNESSAAYWIENRNRIKPKITDSET